MRHCVKKKTTKKNILPSNINWDMVKTEDENEVLVFLYYKSTFWLRLFPLALPVI